MNENCNMKVRVYVFNEIKYNKKPSLGNTAIIKLTLTTGFPVTDFCIGALMLKCFKELIY